MATHSPMKIGKITSQKDSEGNSVEVITLTDYEPRSFSVKLTKASEEQKSQLRAMEGKTGFIPTLEGSMNGAFWMSLRSGSIIPMGSAK